MFSIRILIASVPQRRMRAISITRDTLQMKKILVALAVSLAFVAPSSFAQSAAAAPQQ
jgi:hypothetical protein